MKKIYLISSLLGVTLLASACGSSSGGTNEPNLTSDGVANLADLSSSRVGGSVEGPCTLTGDIRSFEINADSPIRSYGLGGDDLALFFAPNERLNINNTIRGVTYDLHIEAQGTRVVGYERIASEIRLQIRLRNTARCTIRLWEAE